MELRKVANRDEAVRLLNQAATSGLERAVWARQNGIDPRSLNLWRVNLGREEAVRPPPVLRLVELISAPAAPKTVGVRVRCGALVVDVDPEFDEASLWCILAAVVRF